MRLYTLGPVSSRFAAIASSTNANPTVITTAAPHGLSLTDVLTINGHLVNTAANGTYSNGVTQQFALTPTTITLLGVAGNGAGGATGTISGPTQLINAPSFPVIAGVTDKTKIMVARMLFVPAPGGTGTLFVGGAGLNQANFAGVFRPINPPPATGIYDYYDLELDGTNAIPIADYWVDAAKPGTEAVICTFWIR